MRVQFCTYAEFFWKKKSMSQAVFFLDRLTGPWGPVTRIEKNEKDRLDKMKISNHKRKFEINDHDFDLMKF